MAWVSTQATLGAGATQLVPPASPQAQIMCRQIIIQNNSAASMRIGDSSVSATKGIYLAAGPGGGSFNSGVVTIYNSYLGDFYAFGTAAAVVDLLYNT